MKLSSKQHSLALPNEFTSRSSLFAFYYLLSVVEAIVTTNHQSNDLGIPCRSRETVARAKWPLHMFRSSRKTLLSLNACPRPGLEISKMPRNRPAAPSHRRSFRDFSASLATTRFVASVFWCWRIGRINCPRHFVTRICHVMATSELAALRGVTSVLCLQSSIKIKALDRTGEDEWLMQRNAMQYSRRYYSIWCHM